MNKKGVIGVVVVIIAIALVIVVGTYFYSNHSKDKGTINNNSLQQNTGKPAIYATIVSHSEDSSPRFNYLDTEEGYVEGRDAVLKMAKFVKDTGAAWNYEPEWRFLEAALKYEKGEVLSNTNNKNILRYLSEDMGFQIDPHSHELQGYNYADVAYLINQLGVTPSKVVGGFIAFPTESAIWEKFRSPLEANKYSYSWDADVLWGAGTSQHVGDEQKKSGLWKPKSESDFFTNDANANLIYLGGCADIDLLVDSIYISKTAPADKMYNVVIFIAEDDLQDTGKFSNYELQIEQINEYVQKGYVKWATFDEIVNIWQTEYNSEPNMFNCEASNIQQTNPAQGNQQATGSCGDGLCQDIERTRAACPADCG